jgi:hypothetical protein
MSYLNQFLDGVTTRPFANLFHLLTLPPDRLWASFSLLTAIVVVCELVRISLGTALTQSRLAHFVICTLTFAFQSILLAVVLVIADRAYPGRGWLNLLVPHGTSDAARSSGKRRRRPRLHGGGCADHVPGRHRLRGHQLR